MRKLLSITLACCVLSLAWLPTASRAASMFANSSQGSGASWTNAIWKTNNTGTAVGWPTHPSLGNTYTYIPNATPWGNNLGNARTRNPVASSTTVIIFPGDSLTMTTNTEIRTKNITSGATGAPTLNFPGVGGNPGLILDGGILNVGDDGVPSFSGKIQVAGTSFLCPGDNGAGTTVRRLRAITISGQLSGSGSLVILQTTTNLAQTISGTGNTYSGQWFVKAGRLLGATVDSLGTNSITVDPNLLPPPPLNATVAATNGWFLGPAVVEVNYTLNSAGVLTLINGGIMKLHGSAVFSAAYIEGIGLSAGTHYFPELLASFPNNFEPGGYGAITIQPYGAPPALPPLILTQPLPQSTYAGSTSHFMVAASDNGFPPLTYQWRRDGANIADGGNLAGTTTPILIVSGVSAADAAGYDVVVRNTSGSVTSSVAALTLVAPSGEAYESAVRTAGPVAFYQLNETGDPAPGNLEAFDFVGGYAGIYGNQVQNGNVGYNIAGPRPTDGFTGFGAGNTAALFSNPSPGARISVLPWKLNTNTVTITAWINPNGVQANNNGLVYCRGGTTVAGLGYNNVGTLIYNWNNEQPTYSWSSGLIPPLSQWSLVALVVTPTNATIYVLNTSGLAASSHAYTHVNQGFDGTTLIGDDSYDGGNGTRAFSGTIDDVAVFNYALSQGQLLALYTAASGVSSFAPAIAVPPVSQTLYQGQTAQFTGVATGTEPLTYQWQAGPIGSGVYANLTDGGQFSGSTTPTLTVSNINTPSGLDYVLWASNSVGTTMSTPPATLTVLTTTSAENIIITNQQASGLDWDTADAALSWLDGLGATTSAAAKPGSTYEVMPGARLRSPQNPVAAPFRGSLLTVNGDGVWNVNPGAGATIGEIRFKQPTYGLVNGTVNFPKLRMNGGQLDAGNDGTLTIGGEINILTNAPFNNDGGGDRGYRIDAWLTGSGNIEYHGYVQSTYMAGYSNNLNIACSSNTFSGRWNVVTGTLLGTGTNSLGTNHIIVGANAALEATYDIKNTNAYLVLNGKMFLHQTHRFKSAVVNGVSLAPGTYTYDALNISYPTNFPFNWTPQNGVTNSSISGAIIVTANATPLITSQPVSVTTNGQLSARFQVSAIGGLPLAYQWQAGAFGSGVYTNLSDAGNLSGSTNTTLTITNVGAANGLDYIVVVTNKYGAATSSVARLTVISGPTITLQPQSQTLYGQQSAQFLVSALGDLPLYYQWRAGVVGSGVYVNLSDAGNISGSTTTNLTITNVVAANDLDYVVVITNAFGVATSSVATLTVRSEPLITSEPQSLTLYEHQTAQFRVGALGLLPQFEQWQARDSGSGLFTNINNGGKFSGVLTTNLTITDIGFANAGDYQVVINTPGGQIISAVATLTVLATNPPENITMSVQQAQNMDWNNGVDWSDGLPASVSAPYKPGSTYAILAGARMRTPTNAVGGSFPGNLITVQGDGVFVNGGSTNIGEIRLKHAAVYFPKLVMNGGQIDQGDNSVAVIGGEMDIMANTPLYVDSSAAQERQLQIDAWLTGSGSIEWHQYSAAFVANLNITGTSNTFSGKWNVVQGALLGSGTNSLGTNDITVAANGALETLYDINSPGANLVLDGQMFLHQNDTFHGALVGGVSLAPGTHTFAELSAAYPASFPASWPLQAGSSISTGSGSLTVLAPPPRVLLFGFSGSSLQLTWSPGILLEATNVNGPWTTNAATSPYTVPLTEPQKFFRVQMP
jgi:Concanavalin A-like lectin/glucanases superfamily